MARPAPKKFMIELECIAPGSQDLANVIWAEDNVENPRKFYLTTDQGRLTEQEMLQFMKYFYKVVKLTPIEFVGRSKGTTK